MARGNIYEVSKKESCVGSMDESLFYGMLDELKVDFVSNGVFSENQFFLQTMKDAGAEVGKDEKEYFILTDEVKRNYFKDRFEKLKTCLSALSLDTFSLTGMYEISDLIENRYGDCISMDGDTKTVDAWLREAETGVKYYVGNVVNMH